MDVCEACQRTTPCDPCKMNAWQQLHVCAWCDSVRMNMKTMYDFVFCSNKCQWLFFERYPQFWRGG